MFTVEFAGDWKQFLEVTEMCVKCQLPARGASNPRLIEAGRENTATEGREGDRLHLQTLGVPASAPFQMRKQSPGKNWPHARPPYFYSREMSTTLNTCSWPVCLASMYQPQQEICLGIPHSR